MKVHISRLSIGRKLAATIAIAVTLSGLLTTAMSLWQEYSRYAASHREALAAAAAAFSSAVAGPVLRGDQAGTFEALRGIGGVPRFQHAVVKDLSGRILAEVGASARLDADAVVEGSEGALLDLLTSRSIVISVPVIDGTDAIGELEILSDASDLLGGLARSLATSLAGTAVALGVGLSIVAPLYKAIVRPLAGLTDAMKRVREGHDLSSRLPAGGDDEIGTLVAGFNSMLSEIGERDDRLARHLERLEEDVEERTRDLVAAKADADNANAAKSDFLATMSHEIRTPMTGMLVMAELLASDELPPRSRRYADVISASGKTLLAIINDILDFAKIEAGKMELEAVPVSVEQIAGTVLNLFHARATEKGIDLAVRIAPGVPVLIRADPVRLNQVISNLVNNALKFTEQGHVIIDVSPLSSPSLILRVTVSDTGIGIEAEKLDAIFEAFGQADQSTSRRYGGTGLGLAISNRLVRAMGGAIRVESEVGRGSSFSFDLATSEIERAPHPVRLDAGGTDYRVIIAVKGSASLETLGSFLRDSGAEVATGTLAGVPGQGACQLVIADASRLIADGVRPPADHVVAILRADERSETGLDGLADAVLTKPIMPSDLRNLVGQLSKGERLGNGAVANAAQAGARAVYPNARVLVADDTPVNREVLAGALGRSSIRPTLVTNGQEAVEAFETNEYDLVLMDGSMPVLDGFEACRRIRRREAESGRARTPIVALTAHVVGSAADAWKKAGMDGILYKPYTMADLDLCLSVWLGKAAVMPASDPLKHLQAPASAGTTPLPLFDRAVLDEIAGVSERSGDGFARRVFDLYIEHAPRTCKHVEEALAIGDHDGMAMAAHALKSMSFNVGAVRVADIAGHLERAARMSDVDGSIVASLSQAVAFTLQRMAAMEAGGGTSARDRGPLDLAADGHDRARRAIL